MKTTDRSTLIAGLCTGATLAGFLLTPAGAQIVSSCKTSTPQHFPSYTDTTPGWSATETVANTKFQLVVGDIDGDGNDELIALPKGQNRIEVWRWSFTTWTPTTVFPGATITANLPGGTATQLHLADVDGDGGKELVVYVQSSDTSASANDQEQIYRFDPLTLQWSLLTSYSVPRSEGHSYWFKATPGEKQDSRFRLHASSIGLNKFQSGAWAPLSGDGTNIFLASNIASCATGACIAFTDIDGNGTTDIVGLGANGTVFFHLTPANSPLFSGSALISQVQAPISSGSIWDETLSSWQIGDIDGDGKDEMIFNSLYNSGSGNLAYLAAYYYDNNAKDYVPVPKPAGSPTPGPGSYYTPVDASITILPRRLSGVNVGASGVALLGPDAVTLFQYQNKAGVRSFVGGVNLMTDTVSGGLPPVKNALLQTGYEGYLRFAVQQSGLVLLARSANGILSAPEAKTGATTLPFVDPNFYTDRGYPAYSGVAQTAAYKAISVHATGINLDVRSLYRDPAAPWAAILIKLETMTLPAAPSGISASDWAAAFQTVQNQTIAEITAVETVNQLYSVTGQLLTNTYLVKDAALEEITDVLNLPGQPDIASQALGYVTTALNGLASLLYGVNGFMVLAELPKDLEKITNNIGAAGGLISTLGAIASDTAQYTADTPPDLTNGKYSLKLALDNSDLGAATANTCRHLQTLSSWTEAKPVADGVASGLIPLDLETQQDVLQASQAVFQMTAWQTLGPSVWSIVATTGFQGNNSYPASYVVDGLCTVPLGEVHRSLVLDNTATNNFPNLTSLSALFQPPPAGLGAIPSNVLTQQNGWSFPFLAPTGLWYLNTGLPSTNCSSLASEASPLAPSALARPARRIPSTSNQEAAARLAQLIAGIKVTLTDTKFRDRMAMFLDVASSRLQHAQQFQQEPKETVRLLNEVAQQLEFYGRQGVSDSDASMKYAEDAVTIRNLLINSPGSNALASVK